MQNPTPRVMRRGGRGPVGHASLGRVVGLFGLLFGLAGLLGRASAQQKIGYIDSQAILDELPEYATVQQKLDQLEKKWRAEIQEQKEKVEKLRQEFRAWELLYTEEERREKQAAIEKAQKNVEQLRQRYFGPEGQLYARQKELMRPIQERILSATEAVATRQGYDYVFDKGEKVLFMYARDEYNLNEAVLRELGVNTSEQAERE